MKTMNKVFAWAYNRHPITTLFTLALSPSSCYNLNFFPIPNFFKHIVLKCFKMKHNIWCSAVSHIIFDRELLYPFGTDQILDGHFLEKVLSCSMALSEFQDDLKDYCIEFSSHNS
mmetsp:Transcript_17521/g.25929  ORF Transcript_17521/g.25929 Transcript_17521/m.25929 type:complete len:115 (-) Transcript_17521:59-403(-)